MKKEINILNQKRTNAFMLSPVAFALAACGGGGSEISHAIVEDDDDNLNTNDPLPSDSSEWSWDYPSSINVSLGNPWNTSVGQHFYSFESHHVYSAFGGIFNEGFTIDVHPELQERLTQDDGIIRTITWLNDDGVISDASGFSYTTTQADVDKKIYLEVVTFDENGSPTSLHLYYTFPIENINDEPVGDLQINGQMTVGKILEADVSKITDEDGLGEFSYQWFRDFRGYKEIEGATNSTYTLSDIDVGSRIRVEASYVDGFGTLETFMFQSTTIVSTTVPFTNVIPEVISVVGETQWGDTWYTGDAALAVDGDSITRWTYEGLGQITFDLGKEYNIDSIFITFDGSVSNGNSIKLYVDDALVASGVQPASAKTWDIEDIVGRYVTYETVAEPHNEYLQVATWSEISEFSVMAQEIIA